MTLRLAYRFSELADRYCLLRGASTDPSTLDSAWQPHVNGAKAVFGLAASGLAGLLLDPAISGWEGSLTELAESAPAWPEKVGGVPVRRFVTEVVELLAATEALYRASVLAERQATTAAAVDYLNTRLAPVEAECLSFICDAFGLGAFDGVVPVTIVASGVPFGGMTSADLDDRPQCLVAVTGHDDTLLAEVVLHEATHALGLLSPAGDTSAMARLQHAVATRGLGADPDLGQLWHVPLFITAAEAVRRFITDGHEPYGTRRGYYAKVPRAAAIAIEPWQSRLDGRLTLDSAVAAMTAGLDG